MYLPDCVGVKKVEWETAQEKEAIETTLLFSTINGEVANICANGSVHVKKCVLTEPINVEKKELMPSSLLILISSICGINTNTIHPYYAGFSHCHL